MRTGLVGLTGCLSDREICVVLYSQDQVRVIARAGREIARLAASVVRWCQHLPLGSPAKWRGSNIAQLL